MKKTVLQCLKIIGVLPTDLTSCDSLQQEFVNIKRVYFKKILVCHPDKGGDAEVFRNVQTSFEVLRGIYEKEAISSFITESAFSAQNFDDVFRDFGEMPTPSWEYYHEAAEENFPLYRVERARSNRSRCTQTTKLGKKCGDDKLIASGSVRVGSLDEKTGTYTRWNHLECWRVPSRIWLGIASSREDEDSVLNTKNVLQSLLQMNDVLLSGINEMNVEGQMEFVTHIMDRSSWARISQRRNINSSKELDMSVAKQTQPARQAAVFPRDGPSSRESFIVPIPGENGVASDALKGKRVVLTGVFPEVGGGRGLTLGKEKVKKMVESFGGRVTGSVSGKTDMLIVGKDPGFSKVSQARGRSVTLLSLKDLKEGIESNCLEYTRHEDLKISSFSSGYKNNSAALSASSSDFAIAAGQAPALPQAGLTRSSNSKMPIASSGTYAFHSAIKAQPVLPVTLSSTSPSSSNLLESAKFVVGSHEASPVRSAVPKGGHGLLGRARFVEAPTMLRTKLQEAIRTGATMDQESKIPISQETQRTLENTLAEIDGVGEQGPQPQPNIPLPDLCDSIKGLPFRITRYRYKTLKAEVNLQKQRTAKRAREGG
jgi:hypothetical protein